ncbi:MAG: sigma 54-interacting transcriptional regulator [Planctomycetes bacterium]|nr:sigma 54-interacting transcriptional regulator [Planctomycetota bacterium]
MPSPLGPDLADPARFTVVEAWEGGEGWTGRVLDRARGGTEAVLKVLPAGVEVREASLLASLAHPAIPRLLGSGRGPRGNAWLLREYAAGVPLAEAIPLPVEGALVLALQLLEVLAYVHLRGILHLDLKPGNIVRSGTLAHPRYVLLDFGLGARRGASALGGTPFFAAPELTQGRTPDGRTDVFALGAVLVAALRPRGSLALAPFLRRFPREEFLAALGLAPTDLPAPFDRFVPRCVARRPEERFADAQEALEALSGGSGRPSPTLLHPDPVALLGSAPEAPPEALPPLTEAQVATHLHQALSLEPAAAARAASWLCAGRRLSIAAVGERLEELVREGAIVPEGAGWTWPDALGGRLEGARERAPVRAPADLQALATRGNVAAALHAYRTHTAHGSPADERAWRTALVDGLLAAGEPARALPLAYDLPLQRARALLELGRVDDAQRNAPDVADDALAGARLRAALAFARGDLDEAARRTEALVQAHGAPEDRVALGLMEVRRGALAHARALLQPVADAADPPFLVAAANVNLGELERRGGDLAGAFTRQQRALGLYRGLGHVRHTATAHSNLGVLAKDLGRHEEALTYLRRARALFVHVGDAQGAALAQANLGIASLAAGDPAGAARSLHAAREELERLGARLALPLVLIHLARAHAELGATGAARDLLSEVEGVSDERVRQEAERVRELLERRARPSAPAPSRHDSGAMSPAESGSHVPKEVFRTFLAVNRRLAGEADLGRAMGYLLDAAVTLTGGRVGYLLVSRGDGPRLELRTGDSDQQGLAFSRSLVNRALQERRALTAEDAVADRTLLEMPSVQGLRARSAVCVPFRASSGAEGALYVEHPGRPGVFGDGEKEQLEILADQAAIAVDRMLHEERLAQDLARSRRDLAVAERALGHARIRGPVRWIGRSKAFQELERQIARLAPAALPVLVKGETGSGKELVARALHEGSPRRRGPFVAENCSAIPAELMESELFGHVKGAFTGADADKPGLLELASGGTLFLDEVGDMPLALQAKLLRALQEGRIRRVGGQETIAVEFRLVAATHKDLAAMIAAGSFRQDLYYRLAAAEVVVPPLRERGDDVLLLAEEFLGRLNHEHGRKVRLGDAARAALRIHHWPGNVRELEHAIARAFLLCEGETLEDLGLPAARGPATGAQAPGDARAGEWPAIPLAEAEARTIHAALRATGGDKSKAAKLLAISRTALYEKLKRIEGRDPADPEPPA